MCVYALRIVSTDKNLRLITLFISSNRIIIKTKLTAQMVQREAALTPITFQRCPSFSQLNTIFVTSRLSQRSALHAFQYQYQGRCNEPTHLQSKRYCDIINTQQSDLQQCPLAGFSTNSPSLSTRSCSRLGCFWKALWHSKEGTA